MSTKPKKKSEQPLVRIDAADKAVLDQLSAKTGESTPKLLHRAVSQLKKEIFFERMNSAYADMKNDRKAWKVEEEDRALFDQMIADGLED